MKYRSAALLQLIILAFFFVTPSSFVHANPTDQEIANQVADQNNVSVTLVQAVQGDLYPLLDAEINAFAGPSIELAATTTLNNLLLSIMSAYQDVNPYLLQQIVHGLGYDRILNHKQIPRVVGNDPLGRGAFTSDPTQVPLLTPYFDDLKKPTLSKKTSLEDQVGSMSVEGLKDFLKSWKIKMQHILKLADPEQEEQQKELDRQWQEKINDLINQVEKQSQEKEAAGLEGIDMIILDAVDFTHQVSAIHRLLHPPQRLHPWLKWMLYLSRVTPEALELYQAALEGRDRIYTLASKSNGRLKIRYQGRVMEVPIFVWPDEAEGAYELVWVKDQKAVATPYQATASLPTTPTISTQ